MTENHTQGNCPECGAQNVPLVNLLCQICDARRIEEEKISQAAAQISKKTPLVEIDDFETTALMDKNDMLIYDSAVHFYGQRYKNLTPIERETLLAQNENLIAMQIRDAARTIQILKIKEQAIRANRRANQENLSLATQEAQRKADRKTETAMRDWDAMTKDSPISKKGKKISPRTKKVADKLKTAILAGAFSDEAVEEFKAKKAEAEKKAAEEKAARDAEKAEKENGAK